MHLWETMAHQLVLGLSSLNFLPSQTENSQAQSTVPGSEPWMFRFIDCYRYQAQLLPALLANVCYDGISCAKHRGSEKQRLKS